MAEYDLMRGALIGGVAGITGIANTVDRQFLGKRLGFKKSDEFIPAFLRGALFGGVIILAAGVIQRRAGYRDMFGFGASQSIRDLMDEKDTSHQAPMPHVSRNLKAPQDYIWSENGDSKYLIIDPKYSL